MNTGFIIKKIGKNIPVTNEMNRSIPFKMLFNIYKKT